MSGFQRNFSFEDMLRVIQTIRDLVRYPLEGEYSPEEHEEMIDRIKSFCTKGIEKFKYSLLIPMFLDNYAETTDPYLREYFNKITNLVDQYFITKLKKNLVYTKEDPPKNYHFLIDSHLAEAGDIFYTKVLDKIDIESCLSEAGRSFTHVADHIEKYIQIKLNKTSILASRQASWHEFYNYDVPHLVLRKTEYEYDSEENHEMMGRIIVCLRDLVNTLTVTLSIPLLLKKYKYIPSNKLSNDIKHLRKLCENYLDSSKEVSKDDETSSKTTKVQESFLDGLDSDLLAATEYITGCKDIKEELTHRSAYLSGEGLLVLRKFTKTVREFENNCLHGKHPHFSTILLDRKTDISEEIPTLPPERLATIKEKIKQKKAFTRQYIAGYSLAKHNSVEGSLQRQFDDVHRRMHILCTRRVPLAEVLKTEKASLDKIYQHTLKANVDTDRTLTRRKAKVLSQIESWIKKYDTDVAAKMFLLKDVTEQLEEQKIICRDFYVEYDRLALEYAEVVAAQLEEERIAEEKAQMEAEAAAMAAKYAGKKGKK